MTQKYANELLSQEHDLVFTKVLSFQLLAETREKEFVLFRGK